MHSQEDIQNTENKTIDASQIELTLEQSLLQKILEQFKGDKVIWSIFVVLCMISLVEVYSSSSALFVRTDTSPILRHAIFLIIGVGVILFIHNVPYKYFSLSIFVLLISIILLIITTIGVGNAVVMNDANRWFRIFGITIQPSEIAKISLMVTIAFLLSKQNGENDKTLFRWMLGLTLVVCAIIAVDNLSTSMLLFGVCFLLMYIGNVSIACLLKTAGVLVLSVTLFILSLNVMPDDWKRTGPLRRAVTWENRILNFGKTNNSVEENQFTLDGENFQKNAAKIAIANGGIFGVFPGNSTARNFLPHAYSDFIYAIIIEEMGIIGGILVLLLYVIILIRAGMIARRVDKLFPKYLVLGSGLMLSIQAFMHMGVNVGLFPVTGQPLPLISLGGTSTVITCAYFGLILSADRFGIGKKIGKKKDEKEVEIEENNEVEFEVIKV
ncbi:MAG: FtsW/RodA/SpoVE family cell cycle protein [Dysgonamonadaceae bacterium]|jgi:cell division protein FtsW|nr:FtsW/RodA/SpoVE family cell cycle protein [Dysgonamonadaceae bacterium]